MKATDALLKVFTDMKPTPRLVTGQPNRAPQRYIYSPRTADVFAAEDGMRAQSHELNLAGPQIQEFVDTVLAMPWPKYRHGAPWPVKVKIDQATPTALYRSGVITVPSPIRQLIVLHEIAHHFDPPRSGNPAADQHGLSFVRTFLDLIDGVLGTPTGDVFRAELDKAGVAR